MCDVSTADMPSPMAKLRRQFAAASRKSMQSATFSDEHKRFKPLSAKMETALLFSCERRLLQGVLALRSKTFVQGLGTMSIFSPLRAVCMRLHRAAVTGELGMFCKAKIILGFYQIASILHEVFDIALPEELLPILWRLRNVLPNPLSLTIPP